MQLLQDAGELTIGDLGIMAGVNWALTAVSVVAMTNLMGQRRLKRPVPQPSPLANMRAEAD